MGPNDRGVTARQQQRMQELRFGSAKMSLRDIAREMSVSVRTVVKYTSPPFYNRSESCQAKP